MSSMEEVWAYREETLYPQLFGEKRSGIYVLDFDVFSSLGAEDIDPAWLHLGVFEFEPTPARNSWLYVTSGGSTPWGTEPDEYDPEEYSWLGSELVIEVHSQPEDQWAIKLLRRVLAFNVLLAHGRFGEDKPLLGYGDRIPMGDVIREKGAVACATSCWPSRSTTPPRRNWPRASSTSCTWSASPIPKRTGPRRTVPRRWCACSKCTAAFP